MKGLCFAKSGFLAKAVKTTKTNNPKKKNNEPISGSPINHEVPTVAGITMLKTST